MEKIRKNKKIKKTLLILIIILVIILETSITYAGGLGNLVASYFVNNTCILLKPVCAIINVLADGVNMLVTAITATNLTDNLGAGVTSDTLFGRVIEAFYNNLLSPEKIFIGDNIALVDVNIFKDNGQTIISSEVFTFGNAGLVGTIRSAVRELYLLIRNACAIVMLSALIYIGIRIILSASMPQEQSKWKERIMDWLKGLVLLIFMHVFLIVTIELVHNASKVLADMLSGTVAVDYYDTETGSTTSFTMLSAIRFLQTEKFFSFDGTGYVVLTILYCYITYMTIVFLIAYTKRFMYMMIMIIIAPIFGAWYGFGKMGKQRFQRYFKEFISGLLVQPFHILIYYVLVGIPLKAMGGMGFINNFFGQGTLFTYIYVLIAISMIRPIEKFVRTLFGFSGTMLDNVASFESGKQTIDAGVNAVKKVASAAVKLGTMVATGGASGLAGGLTSSIAGGGVSNVANMARQFLGGNNPIGEGDAPLDGNDPNNTTGSLFGQGNPNNPMGPQFPGDMFIGGINGFNPMDDTFGYGRMLNPSDDPENPMYNRPSDRMLGGITTSGPINIYGSGINDMSQNDALPDTVAEANADAEVDGAAQTTASAKIDSEEYKNELDSDPTYQQAAENYDDALARGDEEGIEKYAQEMQDADEAIRQRLTNRNENNAGATEETEVTVPEVEVEAEANAEVGEAEIKAEAVEAAEEENAEAGEVGQQEVKIQQIGQAAQQLNDVKTENTDIGQAAQQINGATMGDMKIDQAMQQINGANLGSIDTQNEEEDDDTASEDEDENKTETSNETAQADQQVQGTSNKNADAMIGINTATVNLNSAATKLNSQLTVDNNSNNRNMGIGGRRSEGAEGEEGGKKDVTQNDFNTALGLKPKQEQSEFKKFYDVLSSPEARKEFSEVRSAMHGFTDSLYVPGTASGDWKVNVERFDEKTKLKKERTLNNFVNNPQNINAMIEQNNLKDKTDKDGNITKTKEEQAQELLKAAEPYVDRGITDISKINELMELSKKTGEDPDTTMRVAFVKDKVARGKMPTELKTPFGSRKISLDKIPLDLLDGFKKGVAEGKEERAMIDFMKNDQNRTQLMEHVVRTTSFTPTELQNDGSLTDRINKEMQSLLSQGAQFIVKGQVTDVPSLVNYTKIASELSKYSIKGSTEESQLQTIEAIDQRVRDAIAHNDPARLTIDPNIRISADSRIALQTVMNNEFARRTGNTVASNNPPSTGAPSRNGGNGGNGGNGARQVSTTASLGNGGSGRTSTSSQSRGSSSSGNPKIQQTVVINTGATKVTLGGAKNNTTVQNNTSVQNNTQNNTSVQNNAANQRVVTPVSTPQPRARVESSQPRTTLKVEKQKAGGLDSRAKADIEKMIRDQAQKQNVTIERAVQDAVARENSHRLKNGDSVRRERESSHRLGNDSGRTNTTNQKVSSGNGGTTQASKRISSGSGGTTQASKRISSGSGNGSKNPPSSGTETTKSHRKKNQ